MAPELTPDLDALLKRVTADWQLAEKMHKPWRDEADRLYRMFRTFKDWRKAVNDSSPRDKDATQRDGEAIWDANLHIPYAFSTIETILAQMLAHRPRILVEPRDEQALGNVDNMAFLMDAQQERIHYELVLQDIAKDALITGLGWQKMFWENESRERRRVVENATGTGYAQEVKRETITDDWRAIRCEPLDMRWDPYGGNVEDCGYLIHRLWFNEKKIRQRIDSGVWTLPPGWTIDDLLGLGTEQRHYTETFQTRHQVSGYGNWQQQGGRVPYEAWEYHDGEKVITVLGRGAIVQVGENPCWGGKPAFQANRPTTAGNGLLPGIGEIEPLEHLIREMDTLRTQRRWNAALVLQKVLAYRAGSVDPDEIKFGPGMLIPVNGDPNEMIKELEVRDIPGSTYREEERLEANIERTSGISDAQAGGGQGGGTATEAQLVRAAASTRIQNKARRLEVEIIQSGGEYALELNQQKILTDRFIPIPAPPELYGPERRWTWRKVKPSELMGRMAVKVDGGSTMAENVPQNRQDAMQMTNLLGQLPEIDRKRAIVWILEKYGIRNGEQWMAPEGPPIPPDFLQILQDMGVRPDLLETGVAQWMQANPTEQPDGGPGPADAPDPSLEMAQATA